MNKNNDEGFSCRVPLDFWTDDKFMFDSVLTRVIAFYLLCNSYLKPTGVYEIPLTAISHNVGISLSQVKKSMKELCEHGMCHYDFDKQEVQMPWLADLYID